MKKIEVKILNPESIDQAEKLMVCAARLTQRGHQISCLDDFMDLYEKPYQRSTVANLVKLPHPTIQKFGIINVVVVGASRRFLAQITRHQNEVKYMSASLQYSDYSGVEDYVIPYDLMGTGREEMRWENGERNITDTPMKNCRPSAFRLLCCLRQQCLWMRG